MKGVKIKDNQEGTNNIPFFWVIPGLSLSLSQNLHCMYPWAGDCLDRSPTTTTTPNPPLFTHCWGIKIPDCLPASLSGGLGNPRANCKFADGRMGGWADGCLWSDLCHGRGSHPKVCARLETTRGAVDELKVIDGFYFQTVLACALGANDTPGTARHCPKHNSQCFNMTKIP